VGSDGLIYWVPDTFGANQEAYVTLGEQNTTATDQALALKISGLDGNAIGGNTALILVTYNLNTSEVQVKTLDPVNGWQIWATFTGITFGSGQQLGARAGQDGLVSVYQSGIIIGSVYVNSGATPWPQANVQGGGKIGLFYSGTGTSGATNTRFDNFGGGDMPLALPDAVVAPKNILNEKIFIPMMAR